MNERLPELPVELTISQAAELLAVSTKTVRAYLAEGMLVARDASPHGRVRKMWRIPLEAVTLLRGSYESQATEKTPARVKGRREPAWVPKMVKVKRVT